eukprot:SAG11_NODE_26349_length_346_cov_1.036437_1_plen_41_part_01
MLPSRRGRSVAAAARREPRLDRGGGGVVRVFLGILQRCVAI